MRISDWSSDVCSSDLKTIAAFANSFNGGTLLIGVSDNGESVGLEHDFACLGDADKDRFEIHLRNLFGQSFGQNFTASKLKILFPVVNGVEICQIDVKPADRSEEHTSELQSLMRISSAVFCLKKKN